MAETNEAVVANASDAQRTKCEIWSRVVGYIRPIDQWNDGKYAEFFDRQTYDKAFREAKADKDSSLTEFN